MIVERAVNLLDRREIDACYSGQGTRPYDPIPLLKVVLFEYLQGNLSPAKWTEEAKLNEAVRYLARGYVPGRRTWYDFRDRAFKFIDSLHAQVIHAAIHGGMLDPKVGVLDGTFVAACASRHRLVNLPTLNKRIEQLDAIMNSACDEKDCPKWAPPTKSGQEDLAKRMKLARSILQQRIVENAKRPSDKRNAPDRIQVSLSDPYAALGRDKQKVFRPLYNVQYMVSPKSLLIISYSCTPVVTDTGTLIPMADQTQRILAGGLKTIIADAAYCSIVDLRGCQQRELELLAPVQANSLTESKIRSRSDQQIARSEFQWSAENNAYTCPQGHSLTYIDRTRKTRHSDQKLWEYRYRCKQELCQACPLKGKCLRSGSARREIKRLEGNELLESQREKMKTSEAQELYQIRSQTVELLFADSKANRSRYHFHGRGPTRTATETGLMVVAQNLRRMDRLRKNRAKLEKTAA